jgi:hypothetical protein
VWTALRECQSPVCILPNGHWYKKLFKMSDMKRLTDFWVEQYLQQMRSAYYLMTDEREFTVQQVDKIKKTLKAFSDNFKRLTSDGERKKDFK